MRISNKTLAIVAWLIAAFNLVQAIVNAQYDIINLIVGLISVALQALLGYAIYRDRNDKFTLIFIIVLTITSLSIPFVVIIALMLLKRYTKKGNLASKLWFAPAAVSAIFCLIYFIEWINYLEEWAYYYDIVYITMMPLGYIATVINLLVLGYWLLKSLDIDNGSNEIAYYEELRNQGVISNEEFEAKKAEIKNNK